MSSRRCALIDIGTNTVRLVVGERDENGRARFVRQSVIATRLGEGLSAGGVISAAGMERTAGALKALQAEARSLGASLVEAYATAWARAASNTDEMLSRIAELNLPVWILTGIEEAAMSLEAAKLMRPNLRDGWIVDLGGGSCEITRVRNGEAVSSDSIPTGAVTFTEEFLGGDLPTESLGRALMETSKLFEKFEGEADVVAMGGTAAALGALKVAAAPTEPAFFDLVQDSFLETEWIHRTVKKIAAIPLAERKLLPGMEPERADILVGGALLLYAFLSRVKAPGASLCLYSFAHGLLARRLESPESEGMYSAS